MENLSAAELTWMLAILEWIPLRRIIKLSATQFRTWKMEFIRTFLELKLKMLFSNKFLLVNHGLQLLVDAD